MLVLKTRLHKPEIADNYIIRSRLLAKLNDERNKRVTLIVAASGYGKSITISQWLDQSNSKYCWISLDEELNELRTFLLYIVNGVKSIFPAAFEGLNEMLGAPVLPPEKIIADTLINELDEIEEKLILVLDDYHFIKNRQIHNLIDELLKYFPHNFHLVIISRRDPPLHLSTLKAYDRINEIRMSDLGFDKTEIIELAQFITGKGLSNQMVDALLEKTEGWIVGLRLALIALKGKKDIRKAFGEVQGNMHQFAQYLLTEVLEKQDKYVRKLLLAASLPYRFNKELLQAMISRNTENNDIVFENDTGDLFDRFQKSTLFIITLDFEKKWFRYHHFFREFLQSELPLLIDTEFPGIQINDLHRKASEYFYNHELFEEAMHHALKSDDVSFAVKVVEKNKYRFIDTDQFGRLKKWLDMLPKGTVENNLSLVLARAVLSEMIKDFPSMRNDLAIAKKLLSKSTRDSDQQKQLQGEYYAASCALSFNEGNFKEAYEHSMKALKLLTERSKYLRTFAFANQALILSALGKSNEVIANINNTLKKLSRSDSISRLHNLVIQSFLYGFDGNLTEIRKSALQHHAISIEKKLWVSLTYSTYYLAETSYQWNNLDEAVEYATTLDDHYYSGRPYWVLFTLTTKAFALQAAGRIQELLYAIKEIKEVTENLNIESLHHFTRAFEVELALRDNDIVKASELSKSTNFEILNPGVYFYFPQLTFVKLLIASDEPRKIAEAEKRLKELIEHGRNTYKNNLLMQALLLQSLVLCKKNDHKSAFVAAKEAIKLAEQGDFIRIFIDLGEPMKKLLEGINNLEPGDRYIQKLLHVFKKEESRIHKIQNTQQDLAPAFKLNRSEELSGREIKLLKLISEGYRNKEIADHLVLSEDSIKKYLYYIYQKLDVRNRVAAILRATELGLINQSGKSVNL